jgi:hypothetical protein
MHIKKLISFSGKTKDTETNVNYLLNNGMLLTGLGGCLKSFHCLYYDKVLDLNFCLALKPRWQPHA